MILLDISNGWKTAIMMVAMVLVFYFFLIRPQSQEAKKEAAYRETFRVLKPGGTFCGCFYVQGGCKRTDWFIRHLYQPKGFFTPPYETEASLRERLSRMYAEADVTRYEGIACFRCRK
jgi:ubiquinone/menaquinone biosynthesis C-methylase UbiE